jgi:hypothetical protein
MSATTATNFHLTMTSQTRGKQCVQCAWRHSKPVRWKIDGKYLCSYHANKFWESHFVEDHAVVRF